MNQLMSIINSKPRHARYGSYQKKEEKVLIYTHTHTWPTPTPLPHTSTIPLHTLKIATNKQHLKPLQHSLTPSFPYVIVSGSHGTRLHAGPPSPPLNSEQEALFLLLFFTWRTSSRFKHVLTFIDEVVCRRQMALLFHGTHTHTHTYTEGKTGHI